MSGEDFAFERPINALTLVITLAVLVLLLGGAFMLVAATDQPAPAVAPQTETECRSGRSYSEQGGRTNEADMPVAISGPKGSTCSSHSIP